MTAQCHVPGHEVVDAVSSGDGHTYRLQPKLCAMSDKVVCPNTTCRERGADGKVHRGHWFDVYRDDQLWSTTCLTDAQAASQGTITPGMVQVAMRRLSWPSSRLVVQPPHGRTLVNFDTNFYTDNSAPTTRTVRLLGQRVAIEATPSTYLWHFDDGQLTTHTPGAAYPGLKVTHNYLRKGRYRPSVDTVYTGRYRINGGGWQVIPGTLTVVGASVPLRAVEARPVLVDY